MNKKELISDLIVEHIILGFCMFLTLMIGHFMFNLSDLGYKDGVDRVFGLALCMIGIPTGIFLVVQEIKCIKNIYKRLKNE